MTSPTPFSQSMHKQHYSPNSNTVSNLQAQRRKKEKKEKKKKEKKKKEKKEKKKEKKEKEKEKKKKKKKKKTKKKKTKKKKSSEFQNALALLCCALLIKKRYTHPSKILSSPVQFMPDTS